MILWVTALWALLAVSPQSEAPSVEIRGQKFIVELALTPAAQERGLMFREKLGSRQGMLFVFPEEAPRSFWMKNTLIPLDIIFISKEKRIVSFIENAEPLNLKALPSEGPAKYVLEIPGGEARKIGIKKGDPIVVRGLPSVAKTHN